MARQVLCLSLDCQMNDRPEILIIEDDLQIRRFLRTTLCAESYRLREATTEADGMSFVNERAPQVILLDLGLPDGDGIDVIRNVRQTDRNLPIIVVSVRSDERDKIDALDAGADDFVSKPFAVGELLARLRAALRRSTPGQPLSVFRAGEIEVDLHKRRVIISTTFGSTCSSFAGNWKQTPRVHDIFAPSPAWDTA